MFPTELQHLIFELQNGQQDYGEVIMKTLSQTKKKSPPEVAKVLGRYIVSDPKICHGKPTFRGTRVFVADVLEQVASGMAWESIVEEWHGNVTTEAITEAVQLANRAFFDHLDKYVLGYEIA